MAAAGTRAATSAPGATEAIRAALLPTAGRGGHVAAVCNNGALEGDEACDDGNDDEDDARSKNCEITQFDVEYDQTLSNEWPGIGTSGVDGGKGFFVVWRWLGPSSEIRGRAYTRSGERVTDAAVKLSTSAQPGQARIGTNPEGRSIVTWQGDGYAVRYRVVDPNGTPQGASDLTLPPTRRPRSPW